MSVHIAYQCGRCKKPQTISFSDAEVVVYYAQPWLSWLMVTCAACGHRIQMMNGLRPKIQRYAPPEIVQDFETVTGLRQLQPRQLSEAELLDLEEMHYEVEQVADVETLQKRWQESS